MDDLAGTIHQRLTQEGLCVKYTRVVQGGRGAPAQPDERSSRQLFYILNLSALPGTSSSSVDTDISNAS